jgi:hypothetical protein
MAVTLILFLRWAKAQQLFLTSSFKMVFLRVVPGDLASPAEAEALAAAALFTYIQAPL